MGFFARDKEEVYQRLAKVSVRLGDVSGAFDTVQRAKSRALTTLLSRSHLTPPSTADHFLLARERTEQMRLNECLVNAAKANEEPEQLYWNVQASEAAEQLRTIWEQLRHSATEYVDLRQAKPFTVLDAAQLLTMPISR
jgi:hypothetical protein